MPEQDYVNQEYSFVNGSACGRIDVIGTFNNRKKLAIIEVKAGRADNESVKQLRGYISNLQALKDDPLLKDVNEIIGILLAESFAFAEVSNNIFLVEFDLSQDGFPFRKGTPKSHVPTEMVPRRLKESRLVQLKDYLDYFEVQQLRDYLKEAVYLFTDKKSTAAGWICVNPKSGHLAVHYKGEYIAWFFVKRRSFHFGYRSSKHNPNEDVTVENWEAFKCKAKPELDIIMNDIDQRLKRDIPETFKWTI